MTDVVSGEAGVFASPEPDRTPERGDGGSMSGPAAGWYPDPGGSGGYRYWDGSGWTQALQPSAPTAPPRAAGQPPAGTSPEHGYLPSTDGGTRRRRVTPWAVTALSVLVVAVGATVAYATLIQRGAASPIAAAEQLVAAMNDEDVLGVLRLLPPDEIDAFRGLMDHLPDHPGTDTLLTGVQFEVVYGPSTRLTDGVASIPIERFTLEVHEPGALATALDLTVGERIVEDLRDEPYAAIVAVERGGSWFISPLGSVLEVASRESGLGGAGPPAPRTGAASPQAAVEQAFRFLADEDPAGFLDLLDPAELQILDHYRPLLSQERRTGTASVRVDADVQASIVEVRRIDIDDEGYPVTIDMTTMCVEEPGLRDCLRDELDERRSNAAPWGIPAIRALLEPQPAPLRIGTVTRDARSYLSLEATLSASVEPVLDRMGPHNAAGVVRPDWSPNAVEVAGTPGEIIDVPLHDNWNALRFADEADLRACPPDGQPSSDWRVDGVRVETERIGDPFSRSGVDVPGVVVGVWAGHAVDRVQVRLVSRDDRC